jgi:ABC-type transporter Mla maintaining outer membrane lipid asymmetry ATPase subunit MlaF
LSGSANIELAGVEVAHEDQPALAVLHSVSWAINPGERWAVCGGVGSGKTSLLCTGAGLTAPVAGTLWAFGRDYWRSREVERLALGRRIGFVFDEDGRLFAHMSILENLVLPLQYHTECDRAAARTRALELLAWVGLEAWADMAPARLTKALRRRAALARTLTQPVEVLFLDALLVGLAPQDVRWWLALLRDLSIREETRGGPVSIVASGFDLSAWLDWADRFAVLHDGTFQSLAGPEVRAMASGRRASVGG